MIVLQISELCRARSSASSSVEELAMHQALAAHVREKFLLPGVIKTARASMIATAVEVSLKYLPVRSEKNLVSDIDDSKFSDNVVNINSNIGSKKNSVLKQRKKLSNVAIKRNVQKKSNLETSEFD